MRVQSITKRVLAAACGLGVVLSTSLASAAHHQWFISEIYSNADGTVQFVELKGTANNEQFLNGFNLDTLGTTPSSIALGPNLPSANTMGAYLLLGTAGYASLAAAQGAPAPDRILPNNFLQLDADTVRYAGIVSTDRVYTAGQLPRNGVDSLDFENPTSTVNSPQNFAGATGTIASTSAVPALSRWAIVAMIGCVMLGAGALLRWRVRSAVA